MNLNAFFPQTNQTATGSSINTGAVQNATGTITSVEPYKDKNGMTFGMMNANGKKIRAFATITLHGDQGTFTHILNWNDDTEEYQKKSLGVLVSIVNGMLKSAGQPVDDMPKTREWCVQQIEMLATNKAILKFDQRVELFNGKNHTKLNFHA